MDNQLQQVKWKNSIGPFKVSKDLNKDPPKMPIIHIKKCSGRNQIFGKRLSSPAQDTIEEAVRLPSIRRSLCEGISGGEDSDHQSWKKRSSKDKSLCKSISMNSNLNK
jgi:hypothetical protein